MREFSYHEEFPERVMVARVSRVEKIGIGKRGRTSFEFDGIDINWLGRDFRKLVKSDERKPFALLRILTTERRFENIFERVPEEGDWYRISLAPRHKGSRKLLTWHAQLAEGGYTEQSRGYTTSIDFLFRDDEPSPKSLGAAAASIITSAKAAIIAAGFPLASIKPAKEIRRQLQALQQPASAIVRDVGQANFVSLLDEYGDCIVHYDAGWPVSFNGQTAPKNKNITCGSAPVILSHWDWDHLHAFYKFSGLRNQVWIVPVQKAGFGALRIAWILHSANQLVACDRRLIVWSWGRLGICDGPSANFNQSGLALRVELTNGRRIFMVGDADYERASHVKNSRVIDRLLVTHHGANFSGRVPRPSQKDIPCFVSVGRNNVYKHPRADAIRRHRSRRWVPIATAGLWGIRRGDRSIS